jgi:hypothetical protein
MKEDILNNVRRETIKALRKKKGITKNKIEERERKNKIYCRVLCRHT